MEIWTTSDGRVSKWELPFVKLDRMTAFKFILGKPNNGFISPRATIPDDLTELAESARQRLLAPLAPSMKGPCAVASRTAGIRLAQNPATLDMRHRKRNVPHFATIGPIHAHHSQLHTSEPCCAALTKPTIRELPVSVLFLFWLLSLPIDSRFGRQGLMRLCKDRN